MYLVTGATGNVGSEVVEGLLAAGEKIRVFTRDASKVARWNGKVEVAVGDFGDAEQFRSAVQGVRGLFLMNGALDQAVFTRLLETAKAAGIRRVVFLSSMTAATPELVIGRLHKEKEDALAASGLEAVILRPGGFMSNVFQWLGSIQSEGTIYNPTGTGKSAPIAPEDIAVVAVKALRSPNGDSQILNLTGGEMLNVPEQAQILSRVLGRELRTVDVPIEAAVRGMVSSGVPEHLALAVSKAFELTRDGKGTVITDTVAKVTGASPTTFEAWARKHAARFA